LSNERSKVEQSGTIKKNKLPFLKPFSPIRISSPHEKSLMVNNTNGSIDNSRI
jgi:hypothetical protein